MRTHSMSIMLAGIPVPDRDVLELTRRLRASGFVDTAEALELAGCLRIEERELEARGLN